MWGGRSAVSVIVDKRSDVLEAMLGGLAVEITAGIHEAEGSADHDGLTNAELGSIHEFGTGDIPQRSFIRAWMDENQSLINEWVVDATNAVLAGEDPEGATERVALQMESGIKDRLLSGISPALDPGSKRGKEGGVPLIDSSQLLGSILGKVKRK
jgi:hypothetical protein